MLKEQMLIIGAGGCGNRQLNKIMELDVRYSGIFLNSNLSEMETLENFSRDRRCFYIPNADGCGKDMNKMEIYAQEEAPKFVMMAQKFPMDYVTFLTGSDGGTGAMATIVYAELLKSVCPEKSINVVATFPSLTETDEVNFKNAIRFWNEMLRLKKSGVIDSIQYIDNNKGTEDEINERAMKELNESFEVVNGKLDASDSKKVHATNGYKIFVKLDKDTPDLDQAKSKAINNSVFFMPTNFDCDKIIGDINITKHSFKDIRQEYEGYDFSKFNQNNDGETKLLLSGCRMPKEVIDLMTEALDEIQTKKKKKANNRNDDNLVIDIDDKKENKTSNHDNVGNRMDGNQLNNMFKDNDFWKKFGSEK